MRSRSGMRTTLRFYRLQPDRSRKAFLLQLNRFRRRLWRGRLHHVEDREDGVDLTHIRDLSGDDGRVPMDKPLLLLVQKLQNPQDISILLQFYELRSP